MATHSTGVRLYNCDTCVCVCVGGGGGGVCMCGGGEGGRSQEHDLPSDLLGRGLFKS